MSTFLPLPNSVRVPVDDSLKVSTDEVLAAILQRVEESSVNCLARVQRNNFQVTLSTTAAKESLMLRGIELQGRHTSCVSVQSPRPNYVAVTVLMPYEMSSETVSSILSTHGKVVEVRRLTHRGHPEIETDVRLFRFRGVKDSSVLPTHIKLGIYKYM